MIKAIFFDLQGVVSNESHIIKNYFYPAYSECYTYDQINKMYHKANIGELSFEEMVKGVPTEKQFSYVNKICFHKGAKEMLEELSDKYPLYLASDHVPKAFEKEVQVLGIEKYFKGMFVSYKLKSKKPHKDFFEKVLEAANQKASESVFVDDAKTNLETAKKLGFTTIWVNNHDDNPRNKIFYKPDYEIDDLIELVDLIKKINKKKIILSKPLV
ncbi:MAG: HAD family hydrolase [archaeon]